MNHSAVTRVVSRIGSRRSMSDAPRMHKAKDVWKDMVSTRPVDPHPHNVFEPPYSKVTAAAGILSILGLGYGSMYMGMRHQQYKQGYWK